MQYCKKCLTPDTRPRITFEGGICNACLHAEAKKQTDWDAKGEELQKLFDKFRKKACDVIAPYSGGKDSVYVAHKLKEFGMHPLLITLEPHLETEVGKYNRELLRKEFDCITITPNFEDYRKMAIDGFVQEGRPKKPFVTGISTALLQMAVKMNIKLIVYGDEGEAEYGGASDAQTRIDRDYLVKYYYSGHDPSEYGSWWKLPNNTQLSKIYATHWSKFENWDAKAHADFARQKGMKFEAQCGTFINYAQLSDILQDLHAYMMFVKFGFGRCTSDAGIEIRAGRMDRQGAVNLVREMDGMFPYNHLNSYLEYFKMDRDRFFNVIDKFANQKVLRPNASPSRPWVLKIPVGTPTLEGLGRVYD